MVSVLVPVYNVQDYLMKCVNSILSQTYHDLELILVDDGSTDDSGKICDSFFHSDFRVRVFHQQNQGISKTREFALSKAEGEYVMWVDSDDWIREDAIALLFDKAQKDDADIVRYGLEICYKDSSRVVNPYYDSKVALLKDTLASQWASLCLTFTKRILIVDNDLHFPIDINNGEDYYFVNECILRAKKISFIQDVLYYYNRLNPSSTIATPNVSKTYEQIASTRLLISDMKHFGVYEKYKEQINFRKYVAKEPLWNQNRIQWFVIFPEVSYMMLKAWFGKTFKSIRQR